MALFTLLPPRLSLSILPFYFTSLFDSIKETGIHDLGEAAVSGGVKRDLNSLTRY